MKKRCKDPLPPHVLKQIQELGVEGYAKKVFAENPRTMLDDIDWSKYASDRVFDGVRKRTDQQSRKDRQRIQKNMPKNK